MKAVFAATTLILLTGCQVPYLLKNSWHQTRLLKSRVPIKKVLKEKQTDSETKRKLQLVEAAKKFAEKDLGLKKTSNYESYVDLKRPYVTWVVRAAPPYELKPHNWWFPIVGSVPYKGYFTKEEAKSEAKSLKKQGLDTYVRGVTAYSTLGWFADPVLSSMMRYEDYDLVNVIIHETVHATVFIENEVDFNERLATFVGNIGTEIFYEKRPEGEQVLEQVQKENFDQALFSEFITRQLGELRAFYKEKKDTITKEIKADRLKQINTAFVTELKPKLKTNSYDWLETIELNNAILLSLETYQSDLSDFQKLYEKLDKSFPKLIQYCIELEDAKDPKKKLASDIL